MQPLGFGFDTDAIVVNGVAHRRDCGLLPTPLPRDATALAAAGVYCSERRPPECPRCRPPFETLLSYQLERRIAEPIA